MGKVLSRSIIDCGRLLWEKGLVTACNGNISLRADDGSVLITATGTCLGLLKAGHIVRLDLDGNVLGPGNPSSEKLLHLDIYRHLPQVRAVVHTHNPFTNAFFSNEDVFRPGTFEAEQVLGDVLSVAQVSVNVRDTAPVIERLRCSSVVVLKRHGTVAVGQDLFGCFARIQTLEEQVKTEAFSRVFARRIKQG